MEYFCQAPLVMSLNVSQPDRWGYPPGRREQRGWRGSDVQQYEGCLGLVQTSRGLLLVVVWAGDGGPGQLARQPSLLIRVSPQTCRSACRVFPPCFTPPDALQPPCALGHPMEYISAHWPMRMSEKYLRQVSAERPDRLSQTILWALGLADGKWCPQIRLPTLRPLDAPPTSIQCP